jgi:hypothetical protein
MVGHQDSGVQRTARLGERFAKPAQVAQVIVFGEEAGPAVVAPLDDVQGNAIEVYAGTAGDALNTSKKSSLPPSALLL